MKILVTGGAGYIGSHACLKLKESGHAPIVYDNLVYGHEESALDWEVVKGDLTDTEKLSALFSKHKFDAVMHFAAYAYVGESVTDPKKYFGNNLVNAINLLNVMIEHDVKKLIFSSTCATYGEPVHEFIDETHPQNPINPYGESKLFFERVIKSYCQAYGLKAISLRYFNAAGADLEGRIGESHDPETHLIPLVLKTAKGERKSISIFGDDYDTPDGTCIRDYIHVLDLADAHLLALNKLGDIEGNKFYNLGNGKGFSVKEVISSVEKVTGIKVPTVIATRREGDPARLVANAGLAKSELAWRPEYADLEKIIESAWKWENTKRY